MKKILLLTLLFISCNKDDSENNIIEFSPPNWLIGTWNHENMNAALKTYVITNNNIKVYNPENIETNYSEIITNDPTKTLDEREISQERYIFVIKSELPNGEISEYNVTFTKVSMTEFKLFIIGISAGQSSYFKE